jgi:hypothetical protein
MGKMSSLNPRAPTTLVHTTPILAERQHIVSESTRCFP